MFGLIRKRKIAEIIAGICNEQERRYREEGADFVTVCEKQSILNYLCDRLDIKPLHLNKLGGGTGEMIYDVWIKEENRLRNS